VLLWPESMVTCVRAVVREDPRLTQVVVAVLLGRLTQSPRLMQRVLRHLSTLYGALPAEPQQQPVTSELLCPQLQAMAAHDHFKVSACALIWLYNHLEQLGEPARYEMATWLIDRFGHFALHWSRVVRSIYLHVAVIKVLHQPPPPRPDKLDRRSHASLDALLVPQSRTEPADLRPNHRSASTSSVSSLLQPRAVSLSSLSPAACQRDADYASLQAALSADLDALQQAAEAPTAVSAYAHLFADGTPSRTMERTVRAYAPYACDEYQQVVRKWEALTEEMEAAREADGGGMARALSCGSISSISSAGTALNGQANGQLAGSGVGTAPLVGGLAHGPLGAGLAGSEPSRVVRQLSLSMSLISDDISDDDEDPNADEW